MAAQGFLCLLCILGFPVCLDSLAFVPTQRRVARLEPQVSGVSRQPRSGYQRELGSTTRSLREVSALIVGAAWVALRRRRVSNEPRRARTCRSVYGGWGSKEEKEEEQEPTAKIHALQSQVEDLLAKVQEKHESYDRVKVEYDNYLKRTRQELAAERGRAAIPIFQELFPIADEFELLQKNMQLNTEGERAVAETFERYFDQVMATWKEVGVEKLGSVGETFNPQFHDAVSLVPSDEFKEDVVCGELRGGWVLKLPGSGESTVLRAALVFVSSGPGPE